MSDSDEEEMAQIHVKVPRDVKDAVKDKLQHGGLSREVRDMCERIAFGAEVNKRSRLERQREDLEEDLRDAREKRREIDATIETNEERISAIDAKLSNLTKREDKYEAKLEELEGKLREDGMRIDPGRKDVSRAAQTGEVEPEGVIRDLKERNPDVPDYAFEDGLHDHEHNWDGVPADDRDLDVDDRERRFR